MNQMNYSTMTRDDILNMDLNIDFYDPVVTAQFEIDPLPRNKNFDDFKKIYIDQLAVENDIGNKTTTMLNILRLEAESDSESNAKRDAIKPLYVKNIVLQAIYDHRRMEIINVLKSYSNGT